MGVRDVLPAGRAAGKGEGGFTLAELLVFMGIMMVFLLGVGGMITSGLKSSTSSYNQVKLAEGANEALSAMVRQIRVATVLEPSCTAAAIAFRGDTDGNGTENAVRFDAAGGYLRQGTGAGGMSNWIPLVDGVSFTYYYFDTSTKTVRRFDAATQSWENLRTSISRVDIELRMSKSALGMALSRTYRGSVNLRNELRAS